MQETKEPSSTMLYCSNLPFSFEDKDLKGIFAGYEVTSAYVAVRRNGRSKGFGFVTFSTPEQQKKAKDAFDGKELDGRTLTVKIAHKDDRRDAKGELRDEFKTAETREARPRGQRREGGESNKGNNASAAPSEKKPSETVLYVSNLPFEFTDEDLKKVFAAHKPVSARIARRRNERSKGFGFVEFPSKKEQTAALALDQHTIEDRQITVKVSMVGDDRKEGGERKSENNNNKGANNKGGNNSNNNNSGNAQKKERAPRQQQEKKEGSSSSTIYVSNLPFDLTDESLAEVFRSKGHNPVSARIARRRDDRSKGFGFVEFANQEQQLAALAAVDQTTLVDRVISAKVALKDSETREGGAKQGGNNNNGGAKADADAPKRKRNRKRAGGDRAEGGNNNEKKEERKPVERKEKKDSATLVYVSNLSFDVDDAALAKLFDGLSIKSAHVAVRRNGKSKGFGFVDFTSGADQKKALAKDGTELAGRKLVVEVAKEEAAPAASK
jgi:RNA recognition motif-containing protein